MRVGVGRGRKKERQPEVQFSPTQHLDSRICNVQGSIAGITKALEKKEEKGQAACCSSQMFRFTPTLWPSPRATLLPWFPQSQERK